MTRQEAFDTVCRHLKKQRKRAMGPYGCTFLAPDGSRCAIGALMTEEEHASRDPGRVLTELGSLSYALMDAHDHAENNKFRARLKAVAEHFDLEWGF